MNINSPNTGTHQRRLAFPLSAIAVTVVCLFLFSTGCATVPTHDLEQRTVTDIVQDVNATVVGLQTHVTLFQVAKQNDNYQDMVRAGLLIVEDITRLVRYLNEIKEML